jgi:hypothetical protein
MMKSLVTEILGVPANQNEGAQALGQYQWKNRVLVVFSDTSNAKAARQENMLLTERGELGERDMLVLRVRGGSVMPIYGSGVELDADRIRHDIQGPEAGEFAVVLIGKDGSVKLRAHEPVSPAEIFALVDSMPMRAAEQR